MVIISLFKLASCDLQSHKSRISNIVKQCDCATIISCYLFISLGIFFLRKWQNTNWTWITDVRHAIYFEFLENWLNYAICYLTYGSRIFYLQSEVPINFSQLFHNFSQTWAHSIYICLDGSIPSIIKLEMFLFMAAQLISNIYFTSPWAHSSKRERKRSPSRYYLSRAL